MSEGKMRRVMIQIPVELYEQCRLEARKSNTSISAVARGAIQDSLAAGNLECAVINLRLDRPVYDELEQALSGNGNTAQAMLAKHVDRYIDTFGQKAVDKEPT